LTGGILGVVLAGAFWGALAGGLIGGAVGGIAAAINGVCGRGIKRSNFRSCGQEKASITSKVTAVLGYHYLSHPAHWLNLTESCIPIHFTTDFKVLYQGRRQGNCNESRDF